MLTQCVEVGVRDRIERIELFHVDVPLPTPFYPIWVRGYPQHHLRQTLIRITTRDGLVGHATGAAFDRERAGLGELIGPFLLGLDPFDFHAAADRLHQAAFLGWRNHWIETAFWDLAAKQRGIPLWRLIAEEVALPCKTKAPSKLTAYASFGEARGHGARAESIERALRQGFRAVKLSLDGATEAEDVGLVRAAREAAGEATLLVHAHQGWRVSLMQPSPEWDEARALSFAARAAEHGVTWLQEPVPFDACGKLSELKRSAVPIAGGDILSNLVELQTLVDAGAHRVLTPDVTFAGLSTTVQLMRTCKARGLGFSPHTYSDGLALVANLHALAAWASLEGTQGPVLLEFPWEPPAIIPEQRDALFAAPLELDAGGMMAIPEGPGLGVPLDAKALRRYAQRFYTLTPVRFVVSSARRTGLVETTAFAQPERAAGRRRRRA